MVFSAYDIVVNRLFLATQIIQSRFATLYVICLHQAKRRRNDLSGKYKKER